jgi:hypothetical protein
MWLGRGFRRKDKSASKIEENCASSRKGTRKSWREAITNLSYRTSGDPFVSLIVDPSLMPSGLFYTDGEAKAKQAERIGHN